MTRLLLSFNVALLMLAIPHAQTPDPSTLPLVQQADLQYVGGFRVPDAGIGDANFSYGGNPIAFNPAKRSLFIGSMTHLIAEVLIPGTLGNSSIPTDLPMATYAQPTFADPTDGHMRELSTNSVLLGGLLVRPDGLIGSAAIYYDAMNEARVSHFTRGLSLTTPSFGGWSYVWRSDRGGFVAGYMGDVPVEHQARLGGTALTGQCCLSIISRSSYGPAAFAFDPTQVGQPGVSAIPLLYYDSAHPTLGPWEGANESFGASTWIGGVVIVPGTRSALFVGSTGLGPYCYGEGTADKAIATTPGFCYDPTSTGKGPHSYPYRYQIWAYDLNDFAAVKAGSKQPWEVLPYGVWPLALPINVNSVSIGGATLDPLTKTIYVSQLSGQQIGCCGVMPVIHAFTVKASTSEPVPAPTPPVDPRVAELEKKLAAIKVYAEAALAKIALLKPNSRPAAYIIDALKKAAGQ